LVTPDYIRAVTSCHIVYTTRIESHQALQQAVSQNNPNHSSDLPEASGKFKIKDMLIIVPFVLIAPYLHPSILKAALDPETGKLTCQILLFTQIIFILFASISIIFPNKIK
jgi:hypothetical protein